MRGYDLSIKSSISYYDGTNTNAYTDYCTTKNYVRKYWCDDSSFNSKVVECPSGVCSNGICVGSKPTVNITKPKYTKTIYFEPGWNLFSIPYENAEYSSTCSDFKIADMWHYNASQSKYVNPTELVPGAGYWYYADNQCSLNVKGDEYKLENKLLSGWNHIGSSSSSISFENAKGTCEIVKGPWKFNAEDYRYERAKTIEPGKAYFVKVKSDCQFTSKPPPPPLPN
jgi:hypothetical protein